MLLVGLGNPGASYAGNRHNVGFMLADSVAQSLGAAPFAKRKGALITEARLDIGKLYILKPQGYMNCSGEAVVETAQFYKIAPVQIIVMHDDLDLPLGRVRVKRGGGSGGHNGLRSIDERIGSDYWRLRIGIGHPGDKDRVSDYVLSDFAADERLEVARVINAILPEIKLLLTGDAPDFQNRVALALKPPKKAETKTPIVLDEDADKIH